MTNIAVLVSGGGTNLQALIDAEAAGKIENGGIRLVVSSNPNAFALERAAKAGIETAVLRDFSVSLCRAAGLSADDAALLTDSILFAECRGVTSHGLLRLPQYIARLRSGATASNVPMPFTMESGGTARLDAQNGLGQLAGRKASDKAEELAAEYGVSFVAVANSNHFGTGAWYAIPAARRGFFAFNTSSAASAM